MTRPTTISLIPTEPLARSGVGILANRWARALTGAGWDVQLCRSPRLGHVGHAVRGTLERSARRGGSAVILGLPHDATDAQAVIDSIGAASCQAALLWERTRHDPTRSADGLDGLDKIEQCWVLNPAYRPFAAEQMTNARVGVASLAIPDVFFAEEWAPRQGAGAYAAFLGRFTESKGAKLLAERWADEIWPATGLRLVLAGRGMGEQDAEESIDQLSRSHEGIRSVRLMSEDARARFLGGASLSIFPAAHDYFPQALAEAVSVGTPVVATDIVGHRALAPPGSVASVLDADLSSLRSAVAGVLDRTDETARRATVGRELMQAEQSMAATVKRLTGLLKT